MIKFLKFLVYLAKQLAPWVVAVVIVFLSVFLVAYLILIFGFDIFTEVLAAGFVIALILIWLRTGWEAFNREFKE